MATQAGIRLTLSDTVGLAVDMSPVIQLIDPFDVGFLSYIGMDSLDKPAVQYKHSWMEDTLLPSTDVLNGAINNAVTSLTGTTANNLRIWDLIRIDSEVMLITATGDTGAGLVWTVETRGTRSTAAAHSNGATITVIGNAFPEGGAPGISRSTQKVQVDNYSQIFEDVVQVSNTLEAVAQWAPGSEYARQLAKVMKRLMILIDRTLIYGRAFAGSAALSRSLGGLLHYVSTNVTSASSAQLSESLLLTGILNPTYNAGGDVSCLVMTLTQKQALNKFLDGARRTDFQQRQAGAVVDSFQWDHGAVDTLIDRWFPTDTVAGVTKEWIGFGPLAGLTLGHEILPKTSRLFQKGQITGEYTAEVKSQTAHAILNTLATTIV